MCNRFRVTAKQIEIARRYGVDPASLFPEPETLPLPELFPKRMGWVVRQEEGAPRLDVMRWGVPLPNGKPVTTVRNLSSPFWRSMLKSPARRCLVPVNDFCDAITISGARDATTVSWRAFRCELRVNLKALLPR